MNGCTWEIDGRMFGAILLALAFFGGFSIG